MRNRRIRKEHLEFVGFGTILFIALMVWFGIGNGVGIDSQDTEHKVGWTKQCIMTIDTRPSQHNIVDFVRLERDYHVCPHHKSITISTNCLLCPSHWHRASHLDTFCLLSVCNNPPNLSNVKLAHLLRDFVILITLQSLHFVSFKVSPPLRCPARAYVLLLAPYHTHHTTSFPDHLKSKKT